MGRFSNLFNHGSGEDPQFIELVRAKENGEDWAQEELQKMWSSEGGTLPARVFRAYAVIYKDAAYQGDRDAILKYARGLEWSGRENEALDWYMKLISQGDTDAMIELAVDYSKYGGMGEDEEEHDRWIFAAADAGNAKALKMAGTLLSAAGRHDEAKEYYRRSAEKGNPEGKANYAQSLLMDMMQISAYQQGRESRRPACLDDYTSDDAELIPLLAWMYDKIEALYLDALNESEDEMTVSLAFGSLATHFQYPPKGIYTPAPYNAAYFAYMRYYEFEDERFYDSFEKIVSEFDLDLSREDIAEWENGGFEEWFRRKGIVEGQPLFEQAADAEDLDATIPSDVFGSSNAPEAPAPADAYGGSEAADEPFDPGVFGNSNVPEAPAPADTFGGSEAADEPFDLGSFGSGNAPEAPAPTDTFDGSKATDEPFDLGGFDDDPADDLLMLLGNDGQSAADPADTQPTAEQQVPVNAAPAKHDDFETLLAQADAYFKGEGVAEDNDKAFALYQRCMEQRPENAYVAARLGQCYLNGYGVAADLQQAYRYLSAAAGQQETLGILLLAEMYKNGNGVEQDGQAAEQLLTPLAEAGNDEAQSELGDLYFFGEGVTINYEKAMAWYLRAAEKDNVVALDNLGLMYINGDGVEPDIARANAYWQRSSDLGSRVGQFNLGLNYATGEGIDKDVLKARALFEKSAAAGYLEAYYPLGLLYEEGSPEIARDPQKAADCFERAAQTGDEEALTHLADLYYDNTCSVYNPERSFILYEQLYQATGNPAIAFRLGVMSYNGEGTTQSAEKAAGYFEVAATNGDMVAQENLGTILLAQKNYKEAKKWLLEAARKNSPIATNTLGYMVEHGLGMTADPQKVFALYRRAAALNDPNGKINVGLCYKKGIGTPKDLQKARQCLEAVAKEDAPDALFQLGLLYEENAAGQPQHLDRAIEWYEKGAAAGSEGAMLHLANIYSKDNFARKNERRAVELYTTLFEQFHSISAASELGFMYDAGFCVEKDARKSFEYYQQGAKWGSVRCMTGLADHYYTGEGVAQDIPKAFDLFQYAMEQGDEVAGGYLQAICSDLLSAQQPGSDLAFRFVLTRAQAGDAAAQFLVAQAYAEGIGVAPDAETAMEWLQKAADGGVEEARSLLNNTEQPAQPNDWMSDVTQSDNGFDDETQIVQSKEEFDDVTQTVRAEEEFDDVFQLDDEFDDISQSAQQDDGFDNKSYPDNGFHEVPRSTKPESKAVSKTRSLKLKTPLIILLSLVLLIGVAAAVFLVHLHLKKASAVPENTSPTAEVTKTQAPTESEPSNSATEDSTSTTSGDTVPTDPVYDAYFDKINTIVTEDEPEYAYALIDVEDSDVPILLLYYLGYHGYIYKDGEVQELEEEYMFSDGDGFVDTFNPQYGDFYSNGKDILYEHIAGGGPTYALNRYSYNGSLLQNSDLINASIILDAQDNTTGYSLYSQETQSSTDLTVEEFDAMVAQHLSGYHKVELKEGRYEG